MAASPVSTPDSLSTDSARDVAAVNDEDVPGHVPSRVRGQEDGRVGDVLGVGEPAERNPAQAVLAPVIVVASIGGHLRCDDTGGESKMTVNALTAEPDDEVQKIGEEDPADLETSDLFDPAATGRVVMLWILTPSISAVASFLLFEVFPIYQ